MKTEQEIAENIVKVQKNMIGACESCLTIIMNLSALEAAERIIEL